MELFSIISEKRPNPKIATPQPIFGIRLFSELSENELKPKFGRAIDPTDHGWRAR
jgi:hypothetical protein